MGSYTRPELRSSIAPGWLPLNHAEGICAVPGLRLNSLCDTDPTNLERAVRAFGVPGYADFSRQFAETGPDIVSIATRTDARGDIIRGALRSGARGIHCEKPLATNMRDCRTLLAAIATQDVKLTYGTTRRFMDIYRLARTMLRDGAIGSLTDIDMRFGRSLLMWSHPHSVDLLLFFCGADVDRVEARCAFEATEVEAIVDEDPIVENALISFDNGVTGHLSPCGRLDVVLTGTRGTLTIGEDGRWLEIDTRAHGTRRIASVPTMSGTQRAFHELESAIRDQAPVSIQRREIETGMAILLSIARSGQCNGAPLHPASIAEEFTVRGRHGGNYA